MLVDFVKNNKPLIMGIVNVTPDSFSDGGKYLDTGQAISHGLELLDQGADILDIGGESTRPNAEIISPEEEIKRVVPVIKGLANANKARFISIDTRNAKTMSAAIKAGANIINDISALTHDAKSVHIVADSNLPICLMHMQGNPQNMQDSPAYGNVVDEILSFFDERLEFCTCHNIDQSRIIIDPGIGFGKTLEHNLAIIKNISKFKRLGCPILLGASRKSFIGSICGEKDPKRRVSGSLAAALYGLSQDVEIFRVHDVFETKQAFDIYKAITK